MSHRHLVVLLLMLVGLGSRAFGQATTTHLIFPSYGGTQNVTRPTTANALWCWRLPAHLGITGATRLAVGIATGGEGASGAQCGYAFYADSDSGARLASATVPCVTSGVQTATVAAVSLVQGTVYRWCTCISTAGKSPGYTGIADSATFVANKADTLNAVTTRVGHAINPCVAGVPPTTTGALIAASTWPTPATGTKPAMPPLVLLETP